jgi:hypothetical protein
MPSALSPTQPAVTRDREALQSRVAGNLSMLCALGSADRIAAYLARRGVKAWRRKTAGCAIAVYLLDKSEMHVKVGLESVICVGPLGNISVSNPEHLREFIRKFDNGDYPELDVEQGEKPDSAA